MLSGHALLQSLCTGAAVAEVLFAGAGAGAGGRGNAAAMKLSSSMSNTAASSAAYLTCTSAKPSHHGIFLNCSYTVEYYTIMCCVKFHLITIGNINIV